MKRPRWLPRLRRSGNKCPDCGAEAQETFCEVCGYDLIQKKRADVTLEEMHRRQVS